MLKLTIAAAVATLGMTAATAFAGETFDAAHESCLQDLGMPSPICDCIASRAEENLSEVEQQFFVAMITGNDAAAANLRNTITAVEMTNVATFMTDTPQACASGQ